MCASCPITVKPNPQSLECNEFIFGQSHNRTEVENQCVVDVLTRGIWIDEKEIVVTTFLIATSKSLVADEGKHIYKQIHMSYVYDNPTRMFFLCLAKTKIPFTRSAKTTTSPTSVSSRPTYLADFDGLDSQWVVEPHNRLHTSPHHSG